jgi:hypothetical protein
MCGGAHRRDLSAPASALTRRHAAIKIFLSARPILLKQAISSCSRTGAMYYALNDNFAPIIFQQQRKLATFDIVSVDAMELTEAEKILREAAIIETIAQRLLAGEEIDWDQQD